jgi:hypothetical protein
MKRDADTLLPPGLVVRASGLQRLGHRTTANDDLTVGTTDNIVFNSPGNRGRPALLGKKTLQLIYC